MENEIWKDIKGILVKEYPSTREAERQTGINHTCISQCCRGEYSQSGGFIWKYT